MMNLWRSIEGVVTGELTGAEPGESLRIINQKGIKLYRVEWTEDLTVRFQCSRRNQKDIVIICRKRGDSLRFQEEKGLFYAGKQLLGRPVLLLGVIVLLLLTWLVPTRVLFFRVEGNQTISDRQILETASECGIRFGASRRAVRSEKMKNALLQAMPELKWAGINTSGCTAVISVREREMAEEKPLSSGVSSIVAARDGYITSCTVIRGNALCRPGQVVREGDTLISGYTDCGICIQVTDAQGEIYAETSRDFQAIMPVQFFFRKEKLDDHRRYCLIFGKKRINLWKGSGISPATCGRMYKEYQLTLPGGFRLPVCLGVEHLTNWKTAQGSLSLEVAQTGLKAFARKSILEQSVAGSILREDMTVIRSKDRFLLTGKFLCSEMIGRVITEKIGETNGKNN